MKTKACFMMSVAVVLLLIFLACETTVGSETDGDEQLATASNVTVYSINPGWNMSPDTKGNLWMSNNNGIYRYRYETDRWTRFDAEDHGGIRFNDAGRVHAQGDFIWITYGWRDPENGEGVSRWNPETSEYVHFKYSDTENFPRGPVWDINEDPDGAIWIGTRFGASAAFYDGSQWTEFFVEGLEGDDRYDRYYDCNVVRFDDTGRGYFITWRGGLHVYDFDAEEWLHTAMGAADGTESFLLRRALSTDFSYTANGSEIFVATQHWNFPPEEDTKPDPDGVWHYKEESWHQIAPAGVTDAYGAVMDVGGRIWSTFTTDYQLRFFDGTSWTVRSLGDFQPSADDYLRPKTVDGDFLWLDRVINGNWNQAQIVRYKYQ